MNKEEIKEYLKRVDELELKLTGEDKDTYQWLLFGYNECARLLNEKEQENQQLKVDYELYKDNHIYKNYEVERKDSTIKQLKEVIEKAKQKSIYLQERYGYILDDLTYLLSGVGD